MARNLLFSAVLPTCIAFQLATLPIPVFGEALFGAIDGIARDSANGQPVAQVRITAHNVNKEAYITAISGSDGTFSISKLEPGLYQVAASRDGFVRSTTKVEVATSGTSQVDILLAANQPSAPETNASPAAPAAPESAITEELEALKKRIQQLEASLKAQQHRLRRRSRPLRHPFQRHCKLPTPAPTRTTILRLPSAISPGSMARRVTKTPYWIRSSSPRK